MLYDAVEDAASATADELHAAYLAQLRAVLDEVGVDRAADRTDVPRETLAALTDGEAPTLTLSEAAAVVALADDAPDADAVAFEVRDHLLMGMTTGVLDVDTLAADLDPDVDLSGQEVQQAIEGRVDPSLRHLAAIQAVVEAAQSDR